MVMGNLLIGPEECSIVPRCSFGKLMHDALKSKNKDEIALIDAFTRTEATFGEILESTRQLACGLRKLGLGKSDVVAIINENTVQYAYPVLSCLYLGATINPLNPAYSKRELVHALTISQPRFIICSELILKSVLTVRNELPCVERVIVIGSGVPGETIDLDDVMMKGSDTVNDFQPLDTPDIDWENDIAAILCSSGTTGLPKGVMLTHENMHGPLGYLNDSKFGCIGSGDVLIGVAPCFHILGLLVKLASLFYKAKLVVMEKFKPEVFLQIIVDYKVNRLIIVPSLAVFLAKSPLVLQYDISSVIDVVSGASALGKDVQQILEERFNVHLRQCYGMTEVSGAITFSPVQDPASNSVGMPLPGVMLRVVDPDTNETLSAHQTGEIRIKGSMIMKGYMGNDDATKVMIDNEGFLCTGDLGYYDEEDNVYIVDRLKELIKYKGFQVPPAELEDILLSHPEIKDAGVIGIPDERAGELPLAYVVKQPGATVNEKLVTDFIAGLVSVQKRLYGGVRFIEEIPKNPSGKILRRILRDMYQKEISTNFK